MQQNNPELELNGVGKIRFSEIVSDLKNQISFEFDLENVDKFLPVIKDAALAILQIEQIIAEKRTVIVEALKSMCRVQEDIERELTENPTEGLKKYFALAETNPQLKQILSQLIPKGQG